MMKKNNSGRSIYTDMLVYFGAVAAVMVFICVTYWCANGGHFTDKPLTRDYQYESNIIMRTEMVAECNEVTGTVIGFVIDYNIYDVYLDLGDEFPFASVRVYGKKDQVKHLHVGDTVCATGKLNYHITEDAKGNPMEILTIGECIGIPPFAFRANIKKITP